MAGDFTVNRGTTCGEPGNLKATAMPRLTRLRSAMVQVPVNLQDTMGASPFNEVLLLRGQFEPVPTQASCPGT
ncbi:MAG: hypothetical protein LZF62_310034 [Nitrospira sp.]|nr:MAG: hypothetical protein LZF62_310034 [Nitrospira sp.]